MVSDNLPGVSNAHDQILGDEGLQDGLMAKGLGGMPINRTSSCSSFGSEGSPFAASGGGLNGYHRGYRGTFPMLLVCHEQLKLHSESITFCRSHVFVEVHC